MNRLSKNKVFAIILISSFSIFLSCLTPSILVTREQNAGDLLFNQHRYSDAAEHYRRMLETSTKLGIYRNISMEASVCRKMADCFVMTGNYDSALEYVLRAIKLDSADNNMLGRIQDYRHQGKIFVYMGLYYNGISSLEKALALSEGMAQSLKNENRLTIADNYLALGQLYSIMGRAEASIKYIDRALTIYRQAGEARGEMESYLTLGTVYSDQGDILTAGKFVENSLRLAEKLKLGAARHNQLLATLSASMGDYEKALRFQEKALDEAKKTGIAAQIIWATVGMGDIYCELGDYNRAEIYYREARQKKDTIGIKAESLDASIGLRLGDVAGAGRYFMSSGSLTGNAITSLRMAEIMMEARQTDSAFFFLRVAGSSFSANGNKQGLSNTYLLKGRLYNDIGNFGAAISSLDSALHLSEFPEIKWKAWFEKGRVYENAGDDNKAAESYGNAVNIIEKLRGNLTVDEFRSIFFESKREVYDRLINVLMRNNRQEEAFRFSEQARARAFYDILANRKIDFRGALPGDLISREQEKRLEMQKLYRLLQQNESGTIHGSTDRTTETKKVIDELARVQSEYEEILRTIKLNNPAYADMVAAEPVKPRELQSKLDGKTALIVYWISDENLFTWVITRSGSRGVKTAVSEKILTALIESLRKSIQSNDDGTADRRINELYRILIMPFENDIRHYSDLVVIPNGPLHFIPFQVLKDDKGRYLAEKFNITYSPSASVYIVCNERPFTKGSVFMGVALADQFVDSKPGLPGSEEELKNILPLFPENISAIGREATESFVKKNAGKCNILHFATHGSYNYRQPLYSCLLFPPDDEDDGRLNVWEVFEMNLNAKLVTLSACETGLGNINRGDEMTGLSRAFIFAGSPAVVVSLWAVADYPTSFLMTSFYRYLRSYTASEALSLAQRETMKKYPQPRYWAPFVLIGNGSVTVMAE